MRGLELRDVFSMGRILGEIDIADEIQNVAEHTKKGDNMERVGIEFVLTLLAKATTKKVENEIYTFLADVFEVAVDDVKCMKPSALTEQFKNANFEEWKDFFTRVVRLLANKRG